jgi:hypothetical protein
MDSMDTKIEYTISVQFISGGSQSIGAVYHTYDEAISAYHDIQHILRSDNKFVLIETLYINVNSVEYVKLWTHHTIVRVEGQS